MQVVVALFLSNRIHVPEFDKVPRVVGPSIDGIRIRWIRANASGHSPENPTSAIRLSISRLEVQFRSTRRDVRQSMYAIRASANCCPISPYEMTSLTSPSRRKVKNAATVNGSSMVMRPQMIRSPVVV